MMDRFDAERRPLRPDNRAPGISIDWQADCTGRFTLCGVRVQIAPQGLRSAFAAFGWYGRACHCRGGHRPDPVEAIPPAVLAHRAARGLIDPGSLTGAALEALAALETARREVTA